MSDLESVDLSQESDGEVVEETQDDPPSPPRPSRPAKNTPTPPTPHRASPRSFGAKPVSTDVQNGTAVVENSKEARVREVPPGKPAPKPRTTSAIRKIALQKTAEKVPEKTAEPVKEAPKAAPPKVKRGRPRKVQPKQKAIPTAEPDASAATPASKPSAAPEFTTPATVGTPKQGAGAKTASGEAHRPVNRGRKRRLLSKPAEVSPQDGQDITLEAAKPASQESSAPENGTLPEKKISKPPEKRLYGAAAKMAKTGALKRKRDEEDQTTPAIPAARTNRGGAKKSGNGSTQNNSEVPAPPPQRGRLSKRTKRQPSKEVEPIMTNEVIRIEDDGSSADDVPIVSTDGASGKDSQMKDKPSQLGANVGRSATENVSPASRRQSLPSSSIRAVGLRRKAKETPKRPPANKDGRIRDHTSGQDERRLAEQDRANPAQTSNDKAMPTNNAGAKRKLAIRHSTGNIDAIDMDGINDMNQNEDHNKLSHNEAVKSLLDEVQRNAIPFLFGQDRICETFLTQMGVDVDLILRDSKEGMFEVFSDQVKDALVADRLRLAVGSAKTDLRRGIERLLREFARKVAAPLADAESNLLLRNEVPRARWLKEERRASRTYRASPPRNSTPVPSAPARTSRHITPGRIAEDSYVPEDFSDKDDLSDAEEPLVRTPQRQPDFDRRSFSNAAELKKFVGYSYDNLKLRCYRSASLLKLCAQPGGKTVTQLHAITPLGKKMIRNKLHDLTERGYIVEDEIMEDDKPVTVYSTAAHISEE